MTFHRLPVFLVAPIMSIFFAGNLAFASYPCTKTYVSCNAGYYLSGGSCYSCTAGNYCTGGTATLQACSGATQYQDATGQSACKNVSAGYYKSSNTAQTLCPTGYQSGAAAANQSSCKPANCSAGLYWNGTTTLCTTCPAGYYCTGVSSVTYGTRTTTTGLSACVATESGWTTGTQTGNIDATLCTETKTGNQISSFCSAGVITKTASSASAWGSVSITTPLQASAGSYVSGQTCNQCTSGTYTASAGTQTSCNLCSTISGIPVGGGVYSSVTPYNSATTCRYTPPAKTITGCTTVNTSTVSYNGTSWDSIAYSVYADVGYIIINDNTFNATCTACVQGSYNNTPGKTGSCTACGNGTTTSGSGSTSCNSTCGNSSSGATWATPQWLSNNAVSNLCTLTGCGPCLEVSNNLCVTAQYDVSFNSNGGLGTINSITCSCNETCILPKNTFTKSDYVFFGWSTNPTEPAIYGDQCPVPITGDTVFYAKWYGYAPKLHIGDSAVKLYPSKQSSPSLGIKQNDGKTYWGNLTSTQIVGAPKIKDSLGLIYWITGDTSAPIQSCGI